MGNLAIRLAFTLAALFAASAAQAQSVVRFVRTTGNDANACTLAAPCRTLARGVAAAPAGGEVRVLDSGSFGNGLTITKSLIISGNRTTVTLAGQLNINDPAAVVVLRDLMLNGRGVIRNGIVISDADSVHIVGCEIEQFDENGILQDVSSAELLVTRTISRNNGGNGLRVIGEGLTEVTVDTSIFDKNYLSGLSVERAQTTVANSTFSANEDGIRQIGGTMNVISSVAANNKFYGYHVSEQGEMQLESSAARGHGWGGIANVDSTIRISNVTVTNNRVGVDNNSFVWTRQNNLIAGNQTNTQGVTFKPLSGM